MTTRLVLAVAVVLAPVVAHAQTFTHVETRIPNGLFGEIVAVADFNVDGRDDVVLVGYREWNRRHEAEDRLINKAPMRLFLGTRNGRFRPAPSPVPAGQSPKPDRRRRGLQRGRPTGSRRLRRRGLRLEDPLRYRQPAAALPEPGPAPRAVIGPGKRRPPRESSPRPGRRAPALRPGGSAHQGRRLGRHRRRRRRGPLDREFRRRELHEPFHAELERRRPAVRGRQESGAVRAAAQPAPRVLAAQRLALLRPRERRRPRPGARPASATTTRRTSISPASS